MCTYQVPAYKCVLLGEWTEGARAVHPQAEFCGISGTWWEGPMAGGLFVLGSTPQVLQVLLEG